MPLQDGHIPVTTLHWYWVLLHWLGAAACYCLCRDLRAGQWASVAGAVVYGLMGFVGHIDWPQILMPAAWVPVVFLFFARAARGYRPRASAALCGAALGMAFLSGHHVVPTFTAVLVGGLWAAYVAGAWRARLPHAVVFFAVWLLISAVQVLPAIEYARQSLRWAGAAEPLPWGERVPCAVHSQYSLHWSTVPGIVWPGISLHVNPHVGFAALGLALAAVWWRRRESAVRWFGAVAAGGLLLALGGDFPPYWLIYRFVPMVEKAREPAMAIVLFQLGIAVLAALGIGHWRRWWVGAAALVLICGEAVYNAPRLARFDRPASRSTVRGRAISRNSGSAAGLFGWTSTTTTYPTLAISRHRTVRRALSSMPVRVHRMLGAPRRPIWFATVWRASRRISAGGSVRIAQWTEGMEHRGLPSP